MASMWHHLILLLKTWILVVMDCVRMNFFFFFFYQRSPGQVIVNWLSTEREQNKTNENREGKKINKFVVSSAWQMWQGLFQRVKMIHMSIRWKTVQWSINYGLGKRLTWGTSCPIFFCCFSSLFNLFRFLLAVRMMF